MRPEDFEALTPAEFIYAWLGWSEREQNLQRQAWERERWAVWVLTSIQLDRKGAASDDRDVPVTVGSGERTDIDAADHAGTPRSYPTNP